MARPPSRLRMNSPDCAGQFPAVAGLVVLPVFMTAVRRDGVPRQFVRPTASTPIMNFTLLRRSNELALMVDK
jgi:hypothetical protein